MFAFRMWAVKNSQKRRSARSEEEKSASVAMWRAGGAGGPKASAETKSGNMGRECKPIPVVHTGRYVASWERLVWGPFDGG